jgi:hypothetical protein
MLKTLWRILCPSLVLQIGVLLKKLTAAFLFGGVCLTLQSATPQLPVTLGSTVTFSVLAGSTITNTGPTIVNGNVGLSPGSAITGFPPGTVAPPFAIHINDGPAVTAQSDLTTAYNDAATSNRGGNAPNALPGDIGGLTLTPGLYNTGSSLGITGPVTLNGQGNANSVFVFQIGSALTTAVGSSVVLINGANAANIFWQVGSSATLGVNSIFYGTILAQASITINTSAALSGRALARTGAVTLQANAMTQPGPPITTGGPGPGSGSALALFCPINSANVGASYSSLVVATGGTPPYTYSITGVLPAGLLLNASTGAVTGTPTTAGPDVFTAGVTDSAPASTSQSCSITTTVLPPTGPIPSSLLLVLVGLACTALYASKGRLTGLLGRS